MAHIFLSYAREDLDRARTVAAALEKRGYSVWWDRQISGGSEYSREIEQALMSAAAVVVLWSRASVNSAWVRDEAAKGRDSGRLIPASLDGTDPPLGFGQHHTIDLQRLSRRRSPGFEQIVAAVRQKVGGHSPAIAPAAMGRSASSSESLRQLPRALIAAALLLAAVLAAMTYLFDPFSLTAKPGAGDSGTVAVSRFEALSPDQETQRVARLAGDAVERTFATNFIQTLSSRSASAEALRDADFGLNGTVDRQGDELIASASIIDSRTGRTLWSTERARSAEEGRELASELAIWVADVLRCSIFIYSRMREHDSAELQSRILRWCEAERSRGEQFHLMPAIAQELIAAAPKSGQAHGYLAMGVALGHPEQRDDVYAAAKRALELDPNNGPARFGLAAVPDQRVSLAERDRLLRDGIRLDPDFPYNGVQLASLMMSLGRFDEAAALWDDFLSKYPLDYQQRAFLALLLAQSGNVRQAREEFERIEQLRPGFRVATRAAIESEVLFGDAAKARPLIDRWDPDERDRDCAEFVINAQLAKRSPGPEEINSVCRGGSLFSPALLNGMFGHIDQAYLLMSENLDSYAAVPRFGPRFVYYPQFAAVRADPRFMPLMARLGYPQYWLETGKWPDFCTKDRLPYDCRKAAQAAVASARPR